MRLADHLSSEFIVELNATTKERALEEMCELLATHPNVTDATELRESVFEREEIISTAIGLGVAVPHAKIASVKGYAIAVGRLQSGVDFNALDQEPVRLVFMIGASEELATQFVRVLSQVVRLIKPADVREQLLLAAIPDEFQTIVRRADSAEPT